jgi:hypothetical protein
MDIKFNNFYYSEKDNQLVFVTGLCVLDKDRICYKIVNERDSDYDYGHDSIESFQKNYKRVGWLEE